MCSFRIGHGIDVHQLVENRKCIIGGVEIPYELGLLGHSDADVLLHAITDAILGAAALGDIGHAFPPDDKSIEGISSGVMLEKSFSRVKSLGYKVSNIDATILAEAPKMKPYLEEMKENIAKICEIEREQVNVKATTTEKLGFIGRKEGIAAEAVCLLVKE
ncbi:2-C-methyl-D-erythritol 2,4-cyclodiphosphate synthase [Pilibacter termitis]|uniref:2-C-methyl-D-erythritol 2,4-cyclodiphosphate synthase n=1 Tax=Pilibacter termitis TaxID=263852 RepID=A0A1T4K1I7_9ENTE|nr:2-C-methyl-D-erythritol 2,4-cyclodiphosphate synthase [Pilibacter termitis]SJZ36320.1 2-C-methyl-D-erythritol 2,4-cyclodiphosphate synthase [Pilibacter termitis]